MEQVSNALDMGKYVVGVFLDIIKPFDTVDHTIILRKLEQYGIRGQTYRWFKSYLLNRSQYDEYNNSKSETKTITRAVPQALSYGPYSLSSTLIIFWII